MRTHPCAAIAVLAILVCGPTSPAELTSSGSMHQDDGLPVQEQRRQIAHDFDNAIAWGKDAVAREDFAEAEYDYGKACDVIAQTLGVLSAPERGEYKIRLVELRQRISRVRASEMSAPHGAARLEAAKRHWRSALGNDTFEAARVKRDRTREQIVAALIKKTRGLTDVGQYGAARRIVDQILALDPRNDYAIGVRPLLDNHGGQTLQRRVRDRFAPGKLAPEGHLASSADWLIIPLAVVLPVVWGRFRARARSRASRGLCLACGYDLRATPRRCPECGLVPISGA